MIGRHWRHEPCRAGHDDLVLRQDRCRRTAKSAEDQCLAYCTGTSAMKLWVQL